MDVDLTNRHPEDYNKIHFFIDECDLYIDKKPKKTFIFHI